MKNKCVVAAVVLIIALLIVLVCSTARKPRNQVVSRILPPANTTNLTHWLQSAELLLSLGSNVQASADEMVGAIGHNRAERFEIVEALGRNHGEPNASVLLLRGLLSDEEPGIRVNVLNMLIMQKRFAQNARPEILLCTNDPDPSVRANAAYALLFAFPERLQGKYPSAGEPASGQHK